MPYDGSGNFTIINSFEEDRINNVSIDSGKMDANFNDVASGLSNAMLRSGISAMTGVLNMGSHKIQNLTAGTASTDAVNKSQLDSVSTAMVKLTGNQTIAGNKTFSGTIKITGALNMSSLKITNVANGTSSGDAVNKSQLDDLSSSVTTLSGAAVKLTGNQTIAGTKTFSSSPIVPTAANSDSSTKAASTAFVKNVLATVWPVGSIYIGTQSSCPLATLISGSTWELVSAGSALWTGNGSSGSGTATNANYANAKGNQKIAAGLPNIKGEMSAQCMMNYFGKYESGALYQGSSASDIQTAGGTDGSCPYTVALDASKSNAIYGKSTTVQPPAYVVNVWRRTA